MPIRRRALKPVALGMAVLAWMLCVGSPASAQTTFRIALDSDARSLDPLHTMSRTWDSVLSYIAEPLLTIDRSGKIVPDLATDWQRSSDGSTVTCHLRHGVTFQDGTVFDAQAAKWNVDRVLDPQNDSLVRFALRKVDSVQALGPYTLRIHLNLPSEDPLPPLATMFLAMVSPASVGHHGNTYENIVWPVGTGPYAFVSYQKDAKLVVRRYDGYWGEQPYYQRVEFQVVPDAATRQSMLLAGQTDMILAPSRSELSTLQSHPRTRVLMAPGDVTFFVGLNTSKPPLDDKRVRQALNYAVDKQAIIHGVLHDSVTLADSVVAPGVFGYTELTPYAYDPGRAKALLAQAGVDPSTLTLHMILPTGHYPDAVTVGQAIAGQLRELGIHVEIQTMDFPTYIGTILKAKQENTTEMYILGLSPPDLDATPMLEGFDCTWVPPDGQNFGFYCNTKVQKILTAAFTEPDRQKRAAGYARAMRTIWDDAPRIWLWVAGDPLAYASDVTHIWGLPNGQFVAQYARPAN